MSDDEAKPKLLATGWFIRVRMPDKSRPRIRLGPPTMTEAMAVARAAGWHEQREKMTAIYMAERARIAAPAAPSAAGPTFQELAQRWTRGELAREYPDHVKPKDTAYEDEKRLGKHVYPIIGSQPIATITLADADRVMKRLSPTLSATSRRHVAQLMVRIMGIATYPAKLITASPLPRGYLPKKSPRKALAWLYPDEDARLLGCADILLCYRVLYGFLHREGMRSGEASALDWGDVDLKRGGVRLDENKTDDPRAWALSADVLRALRAWRSLREAEGIEHVAPSAPVFVQENGARVNVDRGAERFREHLEAAKLERPELFERSTARQPIRLHDTRATFITVSLANGRTETWVMDRTGHTTSQMLEAYRRPSRKLAELNLGPMGPMDALIPELSVGLKVGLGGSGGGGEGDKQKEENGTKQAELRETGVEPACLAALEPKPLPTRAEGSFPAENDACDSDDGDVSQRLSGRRPVEVGHDLGLEELLGLRGGLAMLDVWDAAEATLEAAREEGAPTARGRSASSS